MTYALFVFCNRRRDKINMHCWERNGLIVWYKHLEKQRFRWPRLARRFCYRVRSKTACSMALIFSKISRIKPSISTRLAKVHWYNQREEHSEQLDIVPAQVRGLVNVRKKYACRHCEGKIATAPLPAPPIPKSNASAGLLAHIAVVKYQDALPLYRQAGILGRIL